MREQDDKSSQLGLRIHGIPFVPFVFRYPSMKRKKIGHEICNQLSVICPEFIDQARGSPHPMSINYERIPLLRYGVTQTVNRYWFKNDILVGAIFPVLFSRVALFIVPVSRGGF